MFYDIKDKFFFNAASIHVNVTLRFGLHEIPTMIRTFPQGLENNHECKWTFDNIPGMLAYVLFLEN